MKIESILIYEHELFIKTLEYEHGLPKDNESHYGCIAEEIIDIVIDEHNE